MTYEPYPTQPDPYFSGGYPPQPLAPQSKGFGIASMIVGIIAVVLAFIPIIGIVSFVLGVVAIGLGIFAVTKRRGKGQGIAGIITGAASIVVALIVTIITSAFISILDYELQNPEDFFDMDPAELEELMEDSDEDTDATWDGSADALVATPLAYSTLTIIGDEAALPDGEAV